MVDGRNEFRQDIVLEYTAIRSHLKIFNSSNVLNVLLMNASRKHVATINIISYYVYVGHTPAKIVSLPHQLYVLEGERGTIRCQNRSSDGMFYSYISNVVWWHIDPNGSNISITASNSRSVYSVAHTLNFNPISIKNEGLYYCCLQDGSACSDASNVKKSSKLFMYNYY